MFESAVGRMTPASRQNAGKFAMGGLPGGVNEPDGTACAMWIATPWSVSFASPSQSVAASATLPKAIKAIRANEDLITIPPRDCTSFSACGADNLGRGQSGPLPPCFMESGAAFSRGPGAARQNLAGPG